MLSVSPYAAERIPGLFAINERVVLSGQWAHGHFAFCPVAATNVGDIHLTREPDLVTNAVTQNESSAPSTLLYEEGVDVEKGEELGVFRLGSTIVLLFESPEFRFSCEVGKKVRVGESLGAFV
jgi:phosphatidylserine decarboxylase